MEPLESEIKELASKQRRPHGKMCLELSDYMSLNYANMIDKALVKLAIGENEANCT